MKASRHRTQSVTTSWAGLPDLKAERVSLLNKTGADLEIRHAGQTSAGEQITIADGQSVGLQVNWKASEIQIKASAGAAGVQIIID